MLNDVLYSIAGKKRNEKIDALLLRLKFTESLPRVEHDLVEYSLTVGSKGSYPAKDYYAERIPPPSKTSKSIAELSVYVDEVVDFYDRESMVGKLMTAINDSNTVEQLRDAISKVSTISIKKRDFSEFACKTYKDLGELPKDRGFLTGIQEIDELTNGLQPGFVGCMCAFTSQGKSTFWVSSAYKNQKLGKKGVIVSMEIPPEDVWKQLQARFLYEEHSLDVRPKDLIQDTLTTDVKEQVLALDEEFRESVGKNILIVDDSIFDIAILTSPELLRSIFSQIEEYLGGLDFMIWDHVNLLDLRYPDKGNIIIQAITAATKTYKNNKKDKIFTGFAVQCNREGWKSATKRQGKYAMNAISDLNEIEKSATYVMFNFLNDEMLVNQESKVTFAKNRIGSVLPDPVVTSFIPEAMIVGELVEQVSYNEDFGNLTAGGFDEFEL
nr:MAG TPA: Helicase REPLICATION [Caudoviricetes sp.]